MQIKELKELFFPILHLLGTLVFLVGVCAMIASPRAAELLEYPLTALMFVCASYFFYKSKLLFDQP